MTTLIVPVLASVNGQDMVHSLIWLIILGVIFGLIWWLIEYCGLPAPFNKVARIILAICAVILVINFLLSLSGHPIISW